MISYAVPISLFVGNDAFFNIYFQDNYADQKAPNREYFFNILNTVYPEYLKSVINHAAT